MPESPQPKHDNAPKQPSSDVPYSLKLLRKVATLEGAAGTVGTIIVILYGIASWKGAFDLYWPAVRAAGGGAVIVFEAIQSPVIPIAIMVLIIIYFFLLTETEEGTTRAIWLPAVAWIGITLMFCTFVSMAMFVWFVRSSGVPDAVAYYEKQITERHILNRV